MGPRHRLLSGFGGQKRSSLIIGAVAAALLALAACDGTPTADDITTTSSIFPVTSPSTDPPPTSTSTTTSITTSTTVASDLEVIDAWSGFWDAWVEVRASQNLDPGPLEAVATADVVEDAVSLFELQRSSGLGPVQTEVVLHPAVKAVDAEGATVEDCVLLSPSFTDAVGVWYQADLTRREHAWNVGGLRVPRAGGCVPEALANAAIAGYEAFYAGWTEFWEPANPDSALIDQVLADPQKTLIVDVLADHQARGVALRGRPVLHPEVIEVRSSTELVILSCLEPAADYGLYDIESGERLDDVPAVRDGQRNLESAVMTLEDGLWKVSDLQGQVDFACEFAPTDRGLPSV